MLLLSRLEKKLGRITEQNFEFLTPNSGPAEERWLESGSMRSNCQGLTSNYQKKKKKKKSPFAPGEVQQAS